MISVTDNNNNIITDNTHIGLINPFRYRSYYYDEETKLYYLNSRYYNPEWGRFINADGIIGANQDILSLNLYAYVSNNSSSSKDENGEWILGLVVASVAVAASAAVIVLKNSVGMFIKSAVSPSDKSYKDSSALADTVKKSKTMKKITKDNLKDFKKSKKKEKNYNFNNDSYGLNSLYDYDMKLSVGSFHYDMTITDESNYYLVNVKIDDTYNFDGYWEVKDYKDVLNNIGYFLQEHGILKTYKWDLEYSIKIEKE